MAYENINGGESRVGDAKSNKVRGDGDATIINMVNGRQ